MSGRVVALSGGIGGAKLALGLSHIVPTDELVVVANTGDDFEHLGLSISPDLDTLMYTLAGLADEVQGWGLAGESWGFMEMLGRLGGESWFRLGDRDLAVHVERTRRLRDGIPLTRVTADLCTALGLGVTVLPMSDDPIRTRVETDEGWLDFQDYFVRRHCEPRVIRLEYRGVEQARPNPAVLTALNEPGLRAVIVCPSNPWLSIAPILAVPGLRKAIADCAAPVVAVSPIIGGRAVKGPSAKIMAELGLVPSAAAALAHYDGLLDAVIVDPIDASDPGAYGAHMAVADTLMTSLAGKAALAARTLEVAQSVSLIR
jgi:LPPG:FO 2-phospho-L-lactate transferase